MRINARANEKYESKDKYERKGSNKYDNPS